MKKIINMLFLFVISHYALGQTKKIDQFVETYAAEHQFNGTVLIQKDSKITYHKSFGVAERAFSSPSC